MYLDLIIKHVTSVGSIITDSEKVLVRLSAISERLSYSSKPPSTACRHYVIALELHATSLCIGSLGVQRECNGVFLNYSAFQLSKH